ncbi:MAG: DUF1997 domain-containing protein [Cyanobacteriota bacterium]|nr:DUF1997 domain-containing protein [Cyanobacteriota bacterium]
MDESLWRTYRSCFSDVMEMRAPVAQVAAYLDAHEQWFSRCAAPMQVEPVGSQGYRLTLGRFGNFGFEVEPTIALELLPQNQGVYRIDTIPEARGAMADLYAVDFRASLELAPDREQPEATEVNWQLDLEVAIRLPAFIGVLPESLVQSSGDHLLRQIVRQVSRRLTWKVQEDFHAQAGLACPPRRRARF